jgi:hypothetical protein
LEWGCFAACRLCRVAFPLLRDVHDLPAAKIGNTATVDEAHAKEATAEVASIKI